MKKLGYKIILLSVLFLCVDRAAGYMFQYLYSHAQKGSLSEAEYYIANNTHEDILMMGSSRMRHHYQPRMMQDSLNCSVWNAGIDGNGIILSYGYLKLVLEHYKPNLIIYDVWSFDMYEEPGENPESANARYLYHMRPYYNHPAIKGIIKDVSPREYLKSQSHIYRYNSKILRLFGDYLFNIRHLENGYWPYCDTMESDSEEMVECTYVTDATKLKYLKKFIRTCKTEHIPLIFTASPVYKNLIRKDFYNPIKKICKEERIPFMTVENTDSISNDRRYFVDAIHLNDAGAREFTKLFASQLKHAFKGRYIMEMPGSPSIKRANLPEREQDDMLHR